VLCNSFWHGDPAPHFLFSRETPRRFFCRGFVFLPLADRQRELWSGVALHIPCPQPPGGALRPVDPAVAEGAARDPTFPKALPPVFCRRHSSSLVSSPSRYCSSFCVARKPVSSFRRCISSLVREEVSAERFVDFLSGRLLFFCR